MNILSLVTNAETVPLHFTLELEGLWDQGDLYGRNAYMKSYMACNGYRFMVYRILRQSPPQRGGSNTKPGDHDTSKFHNCLIYYNLLS